MTGPYAQAARLYRSLGWQGALPVVGKDQGLPTGFSGRHDRWPTDTEVEQWISSRGDDNLAIRLPHGVLGIDVDAYDGRSGANTMAHYASRYGALPPTWRSSARERDAGILLFRVPRGVVWVSDLGAGSDVQIVRFGHRYMVAWPSVHPGNYHGDPVTGQQYRWWLPSGVPTEQPPMPQQLPMLPNEWVIGLTKDRGGLARQITGGADGTGMQREVTEARRVDPELVLLRGLPPGEQDDGLYRYLCHLHAKNLAREEMIGLGMIAIQQMANSRPEEPWTPEHVIEKVNRIFRDHRPGTTAQQELTEGLRAWAAPLTPAAPVAPPTPSTPPATHQAPVVARPDEPVADAVTWHEVDADGPEDVLWADALPNGHHPGANVVTLTDVIRYAPPRDDVRQDDNGVLPQEPEAATDTGNVERFARMFAGRRLRYIPELREWHAWNGSRWVIDNPLSLHLTIDVAHDVRQAAERDPDHAAEWGAWANRTESERSRQAIVKLAASHPAFAVSASALDADPRLLVCENAVVELCDDGWRVRPSVPADATSLTTGVWFDPDARSADWEAFVRYVLPDDDTRVYAQAVDGYTLLGMNPERLWVVLLGPSATGKTTWLELVSGCLGDYSKPSNLSVLRGNLDERPRADLVSVLPCRRIHMVEAEEDVSLHVDQIKRATGGDMMSARLPHSGTYVRRYPAFTPVMAANTMPTIDGADQALRKRLTVIPFERPVDIDPEMVAVVGRLRRDPPNAAILNWLLTGWNRYATHGLRASDAVVQGTMRTLDELSPLDGFLQDWCEHDPAYRDTAERLYLAYECWAAKNGVRGREVFTQNRFGRMLSRRGYAKRPRTWVQSSGTQGAIIIASDDDNWRLGVDSRNGNRANAGADWKQQMVYAGLRVLSRDDIDAVIQQRRWARGLGG